MATTARSTECIQRTPPIIAWGNSKPGIALSDRGRYRLTVAFVFLIAILVSSCNSIRQTPGVPARALTPQIPGPAFLLGDTAMQEPLATSVFTAPGTATLPAQPFNGRLSLNADTALNNIETIVDTYGVGSDTRLSVTTLPPFSFEFVSDGPAIIPVKREPQRSEHPYWEIILEPGRAWTDGADIGWSRAALPFALKEKNQNCVHNGLMTFLYKQDGSVSRVAWQIASETCLYLKVNLWGIVEAGYKPGEVRQSKQVIAAYRKEIASRLPVKPLSALAADYPGLDPAEFQPSGMDDASVYGFVFNGVHYRSKCPTRYGPYPFCDVLDLPSYSLSKSIFAGLTYLLLNDRWPEFATTPVSSLVPECNLPDQRWDKVTPAHLVNMTTGNYDSSVFNADEDTAMDTFFVSETNTDKLRFSCEAWPHKSPAGTQWVYHTTDTFLLGVAMNNFVKQKLGDDTDIHRDFFYPQLLEPLDLSPIMRWTQRTYDDASQPFTGYGLVFHNDDLARLLLALNGDGPSVKTMDKIMATTDFESTLFRSAGPWLTPPVAGTQRLVYSHGFWGVDASQWIACSTVTWVPFMSGYGGIAAVLFPNGSVFYFFTDSNQHGFRNAAVEANKALNYCKE